MDPMGQMVLTAVSAVGGGWLAFLFGRKANQTEAFLNRRMQALSVIHISLAEMTDAFDKAYNEFVKENEAKNAWPDTIAMKWDDQLRQTRHREDLFLSSGERAALERVREALINSHMVDGEPSENRKLKAAEAYKRVRRSARCAAESLYLEMRRSYGMD